MVSEHQPQILGLLRHERFVGQGGLLLDFSKRDQESPLCQVMQKQISCPAEKVKVTCTPWKTVKVSHFSKMIVLYSLIK